MARYLFIESQDPLEHRGATAYLETALELSRQQQPVTVFFVENGAHATRAGSQASTRDALREAGAALLVDEFALRERGIPNNRLAEGVEASNVDAIVELLADPDTKAVWH